MDPSNAIFTDFYMKKKQDKIIVRGKLIQDSLVKAGLGVMSVVSLALLYNIWPISYLFKQNSINSDFKTFYSLLLMVFIIGIITLVYHIGSELTSRLFSVVISTIKSENIEFNLEKAKFAKADIQRVEIIEEDNQSGNKKYILSFGIKDGEFTSKFAFTTFGKAQELADIIKNAS